MTTTLITGANKGLGHETARRLISEGHTVWAAARDTDRGAEAAEDLGARFVQLDVTDDRSVETAAQIVASETGLDVLINNAGIIGPRAEVPETTADDVRATFETNVFGLVRVTHAFLPHLERSPAPVIVNVSSGMGSLAVTADPDRMESQIVALGYRRPRPRSTCSRPNTPRRGRAPVSTSWIPGTQPRISMTTAGPRASRKEPT